MHQSKKETKLQTQGKWSLASDRKEVLQFSEMNEDTEFAYSWDAGTGQSRTAGSNRVKP